MHQHLWGVSAPYLARIGAMNSSLLVAADVSRLYLFFQEGCADRQSAATTFIGSFLGHSPTHWDHELAQRCSVSTL